MYNLYYNLIEKNNSTIEGIKADIYGEIQIKDDAIYKLKDNLEDLKQVKGLTEELLKLKKSIRYKLRNYKTRVLRTKENCKISTMNV